MVFGVNTAKMGFEKNLGCRVCIVSCNLLTKLLMHKYARAEHAKTCKCSIQKILQVQSSGK